MPGDGGCVKAVDCDTGKIRWTYNLPAHKYMSGNSRTPLSRSVEGTTFVLAWNGNSQRAIDVLNGTELWVEESKRFFSDMVASLVSDKECLYLVEKNRTKAVILSRCGGEDEVVRWTTSGGTGNVSSPVLINGLLFSITDSGIVSCLDAATGRRLNRIRLEGQYFSPLVANEQYVYLTNTRGTTTVLRCDRSLENISQNDLDEDVYASIAGRFYIRNVNHLLCIGK